ncbi:MAG: M14 family metallopeptidase [Bacteroidota bacterium]|nr:M14 family metallopeptidase [Bacteroidota bacterium]
MRTTLSILLTCLFLLASSSISSAQEADWRTDFEKSGGVASPDHDETMRYLRRLDSASRWIMLTSFGRTPQGRDLPLLILAKDGEFTPAEAQASGKDILLIQAGIHAGEIDGKDAGIMLLREIAVTGSLSRLADSAIILFMPIFNLDGHERRSPYNRINQNGPEVMGWRSTAQNLNLNRDYMKADAPEMRAWLRCFNAWLPDMLIDCHVTDGIDFQYNLTYAMEVHGNMAPPVTAWERELEQYCIAGMEERGDPVAPYAWPRERSDLSKGLVDWASPPRLSTGYAAVRNRANLLIETHMMKPYADRVTATYRMLQLVLQFVRDHPGSLRAAVDRAEAQDLVRFANMDTTGVALAFRSAGGTRNFRFLGYASETVESPVSGGTYVRWDRNRPMEATIPLLDDVQPTVTVQPPFAYLIPQEWRDVIEVLRLHNVQLHRLTAEVTLVVESTVFSEPEWRDTPYEGRFTVTAQQRSRVDTMTFPEGTYVVNMAQASARAALHLLEAQAPDSFVYWGFFNAVFERKEYFEDYVMEAMAPDMLKADPVLRVEFEQRLETDSAFAASPRDRLMFFYERSPYWDSHKDVYPVRRLLRPQRLPMRRE